MGHKEDKEAVKNNMTITMRRIAKYLGERDDVVDRGQDVMLAIRGSQNIIETCGEDTWKKYEYLLLKHLCTIYTEDKFRERVRELYFDTSVPGETPNIHYIASIIDNENTHILEEFYKSFSYSEIDIDNIICLYENHVSSLMDIWVAEVLDSLAYPYVGNLFESKTKQRNVFADEAQNILFKEFL